MFNKSDIKEHMEVLGSDGQHVGTVDYLEGSSDIKLTKSDPSYLTFTTVSRGEYGEQQPRDISVPIPAGHEEEAETLVERFKQRFSLT